MVEDQALTDEDTIKGSVEQVTTTSPCTAALLISDFICRKNFQKIPQNWLRKTGFQAQDTLSKRRDCATSCGSDLQKRILGGTPPSMTQVRSNTKAS